MPNVLEAIRANFRRLMPNGRAFRVPAAGHLERLNRALSLSEQRAYDEAVSILNSTIADNASFSADDATQWETRLGIAADPSTSLADRKAAINLKLNYPGSDAPRQHFTWLRDQLNAAGFPVTIYENNFYPGNPVRTPDEILGSGSAIIRHRNNTRHGAARHGGQFSNIIANHVDEERDRQFAIGSNYRSTFFVAGSTITTFVDIPLARKIEFRQLILQIKPVQTVGFLFVNYV